MAQYGDVTAEELIEWFDLSEDQVDLVTEDLLDELNGELEDARMQVMTAFVHEHFN